MIAALWSQESHPHIPQKRHSELTVGSLKLFPGRKGTSPSAPPPSCEKELGGRDILLDFLNTQSGCDGRRSRVDQGVGLQATEKKVERGPTESYQAFISKTGGTDNSTTCDYQ
eukprot:773580-Rhodomonas_salina.2